MKTEKMILINSKEAAEFRTNLSGWVSRDGLYFGNDERAARYAGCTHTLCEDCGQPVERGYLICKTCKEKRDITKFNAMPKEAWNGEGMLYSDAADRYFSSWDEIEEYCEDEGAKEDDLRLIICKPQYARQIESDYFCDELAEDGELPDSIVKAMDKFNKVLKDAGPLSWYPGNKAAVRL
jgi:hypothetical protein